MSSFGAGLIRHAAEVRLRFVDHLCPAKANTGEHNSITASRWFRRYDVCASCGFVQPHAAPPVTDTEAGRDA